MRTGLIFLAFLITFLTLTSTVDANRNDGLEQRFIKLKRRLEFEDEITSDLLELLEERWFCPTCGASTKVNDLSKDLDSKNDDNNNNNNNLPDSISDILKNNWWGRRKRSLMNRA